MKTTEQIIEDFQNACLARLEEVHQTAAVELDRLGTEKERAEAALAQVKHETETLRGALAFAQSECSLLSKQRDERDARISNLLVLVNERDAALSANDREPEAYPDERLDVLRGQLSEALDALKDAEEQNTEHEKTIEALQTEVTDLEKQIEDLSPPEPLVIAGAAHEFLRDSRLLPAHLDAPLRLAPHEYLMGLTGAIGAELPQ